MNKLTEESNTGNIEFLSIKDLMIKEVIKIASVNIFTRIKRD